MIRRESTEAADPAAAAQVRAVVAASGSSLTFSLRSLPPARRAAMYAIYAFCREVDDIADEPGNPPSKIHRLTEWRQEIDRLYAGVPTRPVSRALLAHVEAFQLPKPEFGAVIDGMEMDVNGEMVAPDWPVYERYCRRVAGAVGLLSIRAFGAHEPEAEEIAVVLGQGLQTVNILRDLDEDAAAGRLYLPANLLRQAGIPVGLPSEVLSAAALPDACDALAQTARLKFGRVRELLDRCERRRLKPCVLMMAVYERILDRLERRGWSEPRVPVRLPRRIKLWIALRHGLL